MEFSAAAKFSYEVSNSIEIVMTELENGMDRTRLAAAARGDQKVLADLFDEHRDRLMALVRVRLDPRLRRRVDPNDVLQETYLTIQRKFPAYCASPAIPFFLWLRLETMQKLTDTHRYHLGVQARDIGREISIEPHPFSSAESIALAERLLGRLTSASHAAMRSEQRQRVNDAINEMDPAARELLVLRHFEELTNSEAAQVLGISPTAAYGRYLRAVRRLRNILEDLPGGVEALVS
nr:sigma-70 family RNA polymerase sigma factor [Rhodopirellula sp. SM50]